MWPLILAAAVSGSSRPATEQTFDRIKGSLLTIEVHSGDREAKSALGSGYLVSADGHVVTNYHVVGSYIEHPDRFTIRARNQSGERPARLLRFDLVNDLAILKVEGAGGPPLPLARQLPSRGAAIVSFGNPQGLGLSLIEGIFNGLAEKGFVDRMLLSMPLNAGMSGGPILNAAGEVVGTNVSVMWLSNSLSFGVPVSKVAPLLSAPPLPATRKDLLEEVRRQLATLEKDTVEKVVGPFAAGSGADPVGVGSAETRRPPSLFDCWDNVEVHKDEGITKSRYGCNLQFTPSVESLGEVGSVDLLVEHFASRDSAYGFYDSLGDHGGAHHGVHARDPQNGDVSAPECAAERVRIEDLSWKITTCLNAFVHHPGLFNFDLVATSLTRPREAVYVAVHMKGFRPESFFSFSRSLLEGTRLRVKP